MKKRYFFIIAAIIIVIALYIINTQEFRLELIINENDINQFYINGMVIKDKNTVMEIKRVLLKYETKRKCFYDPFPMNEDEIELSIDYYAPGNPRHIIFNENVFVYSGSKGGVFEIVNGEELKVEINEILK